MLKNRILLFVFALLLQTSVFAQVSLSATGGSPTGNYLSINDAFAAINAGTHSGSIDISINANTTEPATPTALAASGQGTASYTDIIIRPTAVVTVSGATVTGRGTIELDGADNVTIDGSIAPGGTSRDLTIQNTAAITVSATAVVRLIGRTTLGLGVNNCTIKNCNIIGNTPGNSGLSGSTVTSSIGIYAGGTSITSTGAGSDYDNLTIENNSVKSCYNAIHVMGGTANQCDNLIVRDNEVGSTVATEQVSFRGITLQHVVNGLIEGNTVMSMIVNTSINIAGIEVNGTASTGTIVRQNKIYDIKSTSTGGYGAYGINITSGTGIEITNNVIYGVVTTNYSTTSTQWNAFGIRLTGGTGHKIYYNSINMYGNYTTGSTTAAASAALIVTATSVTGIDIRNNIFANKMTATATTPYFFAVWFPASYNFLNATLNNNAYMVSSSAVHFVGKVGTTAASGNYSTLADWSAISQVNNATNDVNSHPVAGNSNAPFTTDTDLTIPALTSTPLESTGVPIASLGLPNIDHTGVNRPAGTGTNPDLGAYEFEGAAGVDFTAPALSGLAASPTGSLCVPTARTITVTASDNVGVTGVSLDYSYDGVPQTPIAMTLSAGTALNGTWTGTIPAAGSNNVAVSFSVQATDAAANNSAVLDGVDYRDAYLTVSADPDQTINVNTTTQVWANTNDPNRQKVLISEVTQFRTGTGATSTYPAYAVGADLIELTNISNIAVNVSGWSFEVMGVGARTYTFPANVSIPAGGVLVLHLGTGTDDPANRYYNTGGGNDAISSSSVTGYILRNSNSSIIDVVATNGFSAWGSSGVTAADWSGNIASSSGLAGVIRTGTDSNTATDWSLSGAANLQTMGSFNTGLNTITVSTTFSWSPGGQTTDTITVGPYATAGTYVVTATYSDGTCSASDVVTITVINTTPPVADFVATPTAATTGQTVQLTDLSTNIPTTWAWNISPASYSYVAATTANSQNPQVQFSAAGVYSVTLTASNGAGSDDEVKVSYITVTLSYCSSAANNTGDTDIGNVTFGALNNGTGTPTLSNPAANGTYTDFTGLTPQSFSQGVSYPISVTQITSGATFYAAQANVFIDFNQDGTFDPVTERVFTDGPTSGAAPTVSGLVAIPGTATLGTTRMRVILQEGGNTTSPPCTNYGYGETEDYTIEIVAGTACTGAPAAANAIADDSLVCGSQTVNFSLSTAYSETGISYQWQSSPDGITFTNIAGETNSTYAGTQSTATYYQCIITCSNSGSSTTSSIVFVDMDNFLTCYCASAANNAADTDIGNVTFGTLNNGTATPTLSNPTATATYTDYTSLPAEDFAQGSSYTIDISQITSGGTFYAAHANVFIDYNQDGVLDDVTERVFNAGPTAGATSTVSGSITIPLTATLGTTLMRVVLQEGGNATSPSCGNYGYGETEDYLINIIPCISAAPTTTVDTVCMGATATITSTGTTVEWYDAASGGNLVGTGSPFTTAALTTTTTFYAQAVDGTCAPSVRTATEVFVVTPATIATSTVAATCLAADGSATATPSGGIAPYSYLWSNAGNTSTIAGLTAATYTVTVTDAKGCVSSASAIVTATSGTLAASASATDATCLATDGTATATETGGTAPFTYAWSNGGNTAGLTGLAAATYTVTITDANGCASTATATVGTSSGTLVASASATDATCLAADGTATATETGGTAPFTYAWSNGANTAGLVGLVAGTYTVTITSANGCMSSATATVGTAAGTLAAAASATDATCLATDGTATATETGGTAPFTYAWSNGANTAGLTGLVAGTYTVTITDANGCASTATATVGTAAGTLVAAASATDVTCNGNADGTATATETGGTAPFTYAWSNGGNTATITGLAAATYTVTITDANGCASTSNTTVVEPAVLSANAVATDASANGAADGSIDLTVSGGTAPYTYAWSNGGNTEDISGLVAGIYDVTVTDANGCESTSAATVSQPPVAVENIESAINLAIYPNPTTLQTTVDLQLTKVADVEIRLVSLNGQVLQSVQLSQVQAVQHILNVEDLPSAIYMVQIVSDKETITRRLVVTKK